VVFQKLKGVMKTKSTGEGMPNPVAMGKALIARNFTPTKSADRPAVADFLADIFAGKEGTSLVPNKHRAFLMDTQVKYTIVSTYSLVLVCVSVPDSESGSGKIEKR
jgi:hypothetical protein